MASWKDNYDFKTTSEELRGKKFSTEMLSGREKKKLEARIQRAKETQDRDVSGMEAANPPKKTISSVFKDLQYPYGDKVMAYSDRKIQDESFVQESKKDLEHAYGGKYDVMEGDRLITMRLALEDLMSGKIDQIKFEEIKEDFLLEFPDEAIDVLKKDIKEDGFTKQSSKVFGGEVNMNLKESELSTKPNNPKLYDFSKVKPEMFDVHEGDRIKALIDGLKKGESDKELMKYLVDEFDPYVIQMIKNELKK